MKFLFIDTSSSNPIISIIEDDEIVFNFQEYIKNDMSSMILPVIEEAFNKLNFDLKDIDKIFCVTGPGSFTGIRIGVSIAKTIAWGFNIPVIPISSLEVLASTNTNKKYIVPMIDARRGNVFGAIYDNELNSIKEDSLINKNELLNEVTDKYYQVGYNIEGAEIPVIDVLKIIKKHIDDKAVNAHELNPRYLKLTEAEENKIKNA